VGAPPWTSGPGPLCAPESHQRNVFDFPNIFNFLHTPIVPVRQGHQSRPPPLPSPPLRANCTAATRASGSGMSSAAQNRPLTAGRKSWPSRKASTSMTSGVRMSWSAQRSEALATTARAARCRWAGGAGVRPQPEITNLSLWCRGPGSKVASPHRCGRDPRPGAISRDRLPQTLAPESEFQVTRSPTALRCTECCRHN
jgi:hypothetical protein